MWRAVTWELCHWLQQGQEFGPVDSKYQKNYYRAGAVGCSSVFSSTDRAGCLCPVTLWMAATLPSFGVLWCAAVFHNGCLSEIEKSCKVLVRSVYWILRERFFHNIFLKKGRYVFRELLYYRPCALEQEHNLYAWKMALVTFCTCCFVEKKKKHLS